MCHVMADFAYHYVDLAVRDHSNLRIGRDNFEDGAAGEFEHASGYSG